MKTFKLICAADLGAGVAYKQFKVEAKNEEDATQQVLSNSPYPFEVISIKEITE